MPKMENWSIVETHTDPFKAPEIRPKSLRGRVYGHDSFEDGSFVITSSIKLTNIQEGYVETANTHYQLGTPSPEYQVFMDKLKKEWEKS